MFDHLKQATRFSLNQRFLQNEKSIELANFIRSHGRVQILEIKSNDIDQGFQSIFESLASCPIRTINAEFNHLGNSKNAVYQLAKLIQVSHKLECLNISSNDLENESLQILAASIAGSDSLKMLEIKFNKGIGTPGVKRLAEELKKRGNRTILFIDLAISKIDQKVSLELDEILKNNRKFNPISKQQLQNNSLKQTRNNDQSYLPQNSRANGGGLNNTYTTSFYGATQNPADLTSQNIVRHLEDLLDQSRRETAETKARLEQQLQQLQRREKFNAKEIIDFDTNCNQLTLFNRNLKFELDRCLSEQQQLEREHSFQVRGYEEKVREASKELSQLHNRYQQTQEKMDKQHIMRMKELGREWDNRLRALEDKIRMVQIQNNEIENDIRKAIDKKQRIKIEMINEEENIIQRVENEESNRYNLRIAALESKLAEIQEARELYLTRNTELVNQMESTEVKNNQQIAELQSEIEGLKEKEETFLRNNREFIVQNEKLLSDIKLKELTFEKLQGEINSLNSQIELKKDFNRQQISKITEQQMYEKRKYEQDKEQQMIKLSELERIYRASQVQNARLRQEYVSLAETVQINVNKSIENVFAANNLF